MNPIGKSALTNADGVNCWIDLYETPAAAAFADVDARKFADYATELLGIPSTNIRLLTNEDASEKDILRATKNWLARAVKPQRSDVYIFFAGHGLASDDGERMYLLPMTERPNFLRIQRFRETAIS